MGVFDRRAVQTEVTVQLSNLDSCLQVLPDVTHCRRAAPQLIRDQPVGPLRVLAQPRLRYPKRVANRLPLCVGVRQNPAFREG